MGGEGVNALDNYWGKVNPPQVPPFWEPVVAGITSGIQQISPLLGWDLLAPIRDGLKAAWDFIRSGVEEVFRIVSGAIDKLSFEVWRWFDIWVYPSLDRVLDGIKSAIEEVWRRFESPLKTIADWIGDFYWGAVMWFEVLKTELTKIPDRLGDLYNWVVAEVAKVPGWISEGLKTVWNYIYPMLETVFNRIAASFSALGEWLYPHLENLWKLAEPVLREGLVKVGEWLRGVGEAIVPAVTGFWEWLLPRLHELGGWLLGQFRNAVTWVVTEGIPWLKEMFGQIVRGVLRPLWDTARPLIVEFEYMVKDVLTWLVDGLKTLLPVTPEKALDTAAKAVAYGAMLGGGLGLVATLLESPYFSKRLGFAEVFTQIRMQLTPAVIGSFAAGSIVGAVVRTPMTHWINAVFRPAVLDFGTAHTAYGRGKIGDEEFKRYMAWHGYGDQYFPVFKALAARPVSPMLVRTLAETEDFDPDRVFEFCIDSGYSAEHARFVVYILGLISVTRHRRRLLDAAERLYKEGFKTREWLEEQMRSLGYRPEIVEMLLAVVDYEYLYEYYRDMVELWKDAFRKGQIDEATFRDRLADYIVNPERLDAEVDRTLIRLKPVERVVPVEALEARLERLRMSIASYEERIRILETRFKEDLDVRAAQAMPLFRELRDLGLEDIERYPTVFWDLLGEFKITILLIVEMLKVEWVRLLEGLEARLVEDPPTVKESLLRIFTRVEPLRPEAYAPIRERLILMIEKLEVQKARIQERVFMLKLKVKSLQEEMEAVMRRLGVVG